MKGVLFCCEKEGGLSDDDEIEFLEYIYDGDVVKW